MADDTSLFGGLDVSDIINAALAVYGIKQGQKPPKFYLAPQTPEDKWVTDTKHNLYNYASSYTDQFLRGLNSGNGMNPDFSFTSDKVGNPAFMGGIKIPQVDFSKMPSPFGGAAPTGTNIGGNGIGEGSDPASKPGQIENPTTGGLGGLTGDPFAGVPASFTNGLTSDQTSGLHDVWGWIQQHPNLVKGGATAIAAAIAYAGGPIAAVLAKIGLSVFTNWINARLGNMLPQGQGGQQFTPGQLAPGQEPLPTGGGPSFDGGALTPSGLGPINPGDPTWNGRDYLPTFGGGYQFSPGAFTPGGTAPPPWSNPDFGVFNQNP